MNGDQPLQHREHAVVRAARSCARPRSPSIERWRGFQNRRKATITSSEKIAATMSTSPVSW